MPLRILRLRRCVVPICLLFLALGPMAASVSAQDASAGPDLAAIALNPLDIGAFGLQPYGIGDGRYLDKTAAANLIAEIENRPLAQIEPMLEQSRFVRGYTLTNDNLTPPGAAGSGLNGLLQSTILELPDAATATTVFNALGVGTGAAVVPGTASVGDASVLVTYASGGIESPSSQSSQIIFRTGNVVAWVLLTARSTPVDANALTMSLGFRLLDKIGIVQGGNAPGLSYRTLGFEGATPVAGRYVIAYGGILRLAGETDKAFQTRLGEDAGVLFEYRQDIDLGITRSPYSLVTDLVTFDSVEQATVRLSAAALRVDRIAGVSEVVTIPGVPRLGDASTTITYHLEDGTLVRQTSVRSGQTVVTLELSGDVVAPSTALDKIAAGQVACLTSDTACAPIAIPDDLLAAGS